jgi:[methyl-Co(III) methanol-specific corrinoid protein]:coenzyme M methyltransferase
MDTSRATILSLLNGQTPASPPVFSGLIHVTAAGLDRDGLAFHEIHRKPGYMARAAASTFRLTGVPSAVVPFDFGVPAEALGAQVDFREAGQFEFPRVLRPPFQTSEVFLESFRSGAPPEDLRSLIHKSRISVVCEAIAQLKREIGREAVIGGMLTGPYTLLSLLVDSAGLFLEMKREPRIVHDALIHLASFLSKIGMAYKEAGADFLTVHEMGGSPSFLGPPRFEEFVYPALQQLIVNLPRPRLLAVCGNIQTVSSLLLNIQADAFSVDQTNDLAALRAALPKSMLFGDIDPVTVLAHGVPDDVRKAVKSAVTAGADAVWPGCDLYPVTPLENLRALLG